MTLRQLAKPPLTVQQILDWARVHFQRTGKWPSCGSGPVTDAPGENWGAIDLALARSARGLPGGLTLARLLSQRLGKRNRLDCPRLTVQQILVWADAHWARTGRWPKDTSGVVPDAPDEKWSAINAALRNGTRGLPPGGSLTRLLAKHRHVRNIQALPPLTEKQILAWADVHFRATGKWPTQSSGTIVASSAKGEKWYCIQNALQNGGRGLPGGSSLAQLLIQYRHKRDRLALPKLDIDQILAWADAHYTQTGRWPHAHAGVVLAAPRETWAGIDKALHLGKRGLPPSESLAQLLAKDRQVRNKQRLPRLTVKKVLAWADDHFRRTGDWPGQYSGRVVGSDGENWHSINQALGKGVRGFRGTSSLALLLHEHRGRRTLVALPTLSIDQILAWADAHHAATGRWPQATSGAVQQAPEETWGGIHTSLTGGKRGLPAGNSLAQLLAKYRQVRNMAQLPCFSEAQIIAWADEHFRKTGKWPSSYSGPVGDGESWNKIDQALRKGVRGLPGGSSVARLLDKYQRKKRLETRRPKMSRPPW